MNKQSVTEHRVGFVSEGGTWYVLGRGPTLRLASEALSRKLFTMIEWTPEFSAQFQYVHEVIEVEHV